MNNMLLTNRVVGLGVVWLALLLSHPLLAIGFAAVIVGGHFLIPALFSVSDKRAGGEVCGELSNGIRNTRIAMIIHAALFLPPPTLFFEATPKFMFVARMLPLLFICIFTAFAVAFVTKTLYGPWLRCWLFSLLAIVPGIGFILLLALDSKAETYLSNKGYEVSFLGADKKDGANAG